MPLLKDGKIVDDQWVMLCDDEPVPSSGYVIVSLERWLEENLTLSETAFAIGVRLTSSQSPAQFVDDLDRLALVALEFPVFSDGRAFSSARLLRERYGFGGEIRAVGNVLSDQYAFMLRCGFDSFAIDENENLLVWEKQAKTMTHAYQPAADGISAVWQKRHVGLSRTG
jgi:uncharacterized protein (DUF934 family)